MTIDPRAAARRDNLFASSVFSVAMAVVGLAAILIGGGAVYYRANPSVLDEAPRRGAHRLHLARLPAGFAAPIHASLEADLAKVDGTRYVEHHRLLKLYLMLTEPEHIDPRWAAGQLTRRWVQLQREGAQLSPSELRELARPFASAYVDQLVAGRLAPHTADHALVERARSALRNVSEEERYHALFVDVLVDERIDESADPTPDNLVFPSISLPHIFRDRPEVLQHIESRAYLETGRYPEVQGAYTERGMRELTYLLQEGKIGLENEGWVASSPIDDTKFQRQMANVVTRYENEYTRQWLTFFDDLRIPPPTDSTAALNRYRVLTAEPHPVHRLLGVLANETQFEATGTEEAEPLHVIDTLRGQPLRPTHRRMCGYHLCNPVFDLDLGSIRHQLGRISLRFRDTVRFVRDTGEPSAGSSDMSVYAERLRRLRASVASITRDKGTISLHEHTQMFEETRLAVEKQLVGYNGVAKRILRPLLVSPLEISAVR